MSQQKQSFDEAVDKVRGEMAYQAALAKTWDNANVPSVEAEMLLLRVYLRKMEEAWQTSFGSEPAMEVMRKIAGISTRAIMNHGCAARQLEEPSATAAQVLGEQNKRARYNEHAAQVKSSN